jgi:hypothetical protein
VEQRLDSPRIEVWDLVHAVDTNSQRFRDGLRIERIDRSRL